MKKKTMMKLMGIVTAAALLADCGIPAMTNAAEQTTQTTEAEPSTCLPNPFVDYDSLEEAEKAAGFTFTVPSSVTVEGKTSASRGVQVMSGTMIQVLYMDADGNELLCLRKEAGSDDLSGDYNTYDYEGKLTAGDVTVSVRGASKDLLSDAIWTKDGYSYSVYAVSGISETELKEVLNTMTGDSGSKATASKADTLLPLQVSAAKPVETLGEGEDAFTFEMSDKYSNWLEQHSAVVTESAKLQPILSPFYQKTMQAFLTDDGKSNVVYSPLNVYIELSMLAECTDGQTREQILNLLGVEDTDTLERMINTLWTASDRDDPIAKTLLANSIWMSKNYTFNEDTLKTLADWYHASTFAGDLTSQEANDSLHTWINENTNDLLKEQADSLQMDDSTVMALISTLYLKTSWADSFEESNTYDDTFHAKTDLTVPMMHQSLHSDVYQGDGFRALPMAVSSGTMWIFLPDEKDGASSLVSNPEVYEVLTDGNNASDVTSSYCRVDLSLPKFDVSSDLSLIDSLKGLGITDVFGENADFGPLTKDTGCLVSELEHAARVKTDEDGVEAAAYTAAMVDATAIMDEESVDFNVDHPFLFVLTGEDGSVLFTGLVNNPNGD